MITGLKGLAADGHEINCRTCRSGKTCNVANAHGYWVGACVEYTPEKPMTNADKIRQMSDEELAKIVVRARYFDKFCEIVLAGENPGFCDDDCNECALDWLKREVESDD